MRANCRRPYPAKPSSTVRGGWKGELPKDRHGLRSATVPNDGGDLGPEFRHLLEVCQRALKRGDRRLAGTLLKSYRDEVTALERNLEGAGKQRRRDHRRARRKAQRIAELLSVAPPGVEDLPTSDPPTAETEVHGRRRRDPLSNMRLSLRQADAANEIRNIFEATIRGMMASTSDPRRVRIDTCAGQRAPFRFMSDEMASRRHRVYLPWTKTQQRVVARIAHDGLDEDRLTAVDLVLSVLVDRVPLRSLERRFRQRAGTLGREFRDALEAYADLARSSRI